METFVSDAEQYQLLQDYVLALESAKHHAVLETDDSVFKRLFILFREGKQSFEAFHERGFTKEGVFLKNDVLNHKQLHKNWMHNHDVNINALNVKA
jgi:hypothetical protein